MEVTIILLLMFGNNKNVTILSHYSQSLVHPTCSAQMPQKAHFPPILYLQKPERAYYSYVVPHKKG